MPIEHRITTDFVMIAKPNNVFFIKTCDIQISSSCKDVMPYIIFRNKKSSSVYGKHNAD